MTKAKLATTVPPRAGGVVLDSWRNSHGQIVVQHATGLKLFGTEAEANEWQAGNRVRGTVEDLTRQVEELRGQVRAATEAELEWARERGLRFVEEHEPERHTQWSRGHTQFMAPAPPPSREEVRERATEFNRRTGQR